MEDTLRAVRLALQSVVAAAMLSLLFGGFAGPWGWIVGAVAGLVMGPFAKVKGPMWERRRTAHDEREEEEESEASGNLGLAIGLGFLVGFFASLPVSGVVMLVWFSVAQSPWGSGVWSETGSRGVVFSSDDPAMLWTVFAVSGGCSLLGALPVARVPQ